MALYRCVGGYKFPKIVNQNNELMTYVTATKLETPSTQAQTVTSDYYYAKSRCKCNLKLTAFSGSSSYNVTARFYVNDVLVQSRTKNEGALNFEYTFNAGDSIKIDCYYSGTTYVRHAELEFVSVENA